MKRSISVLLCMALLFLVACSQTSGIPAADSAAPESVAIPQGDAVIDRDSLQSLTRQDYGAIFMGDARLESLALSLGDHTDLHIPPAPAIATFTGTGSAGAPAALWADPERRKAIQATLDSGAVSAVAMTFSDEYPTADGYRHWIDYALALNPDTRFFIAMPWPAPAAQLASAAYRADYISRVAAVHALVRELRGHYPDAAIHAVPDGQAAVELYALYKVGRLPNVSALVAPAPDALFIDDAGRPGALLTALGELVWSGAIYGPDWSGYTLASGYTPDLKKLAGDILARDTARFKQPPGAASTGDAHTSTAQPASKYNILLIVADDLGFNDLAINNGNTAIDTPNMDQLARDGMRFTRHYANAVCNPARVALLTGQHPERSGYSSNPSGIGISPDIVTLPERLQAEGYTTWHIGKWHIGDLPRRAWPDHQGFDHWLGFLNQWFLAGKHVQGELQMTTPRYANPWLQGDTEPGRHFDGHLENVLTDKAVEVISELETTQAPWFLNLWFYAPHHPVKPDAEFAAQYPDTDAGRYRALVRQLDHNVGRVLEHLESIGAAQDTIVVLVSDNGGTNRALDNNAPYQGEKSTLTEGGLRTPLVIRWPDAALNGQVIADTVSITDIYPTLLASIGAAIPEDLDGYSFLASVQQQSPIKSRTLYWEHGDSYGVLTADGNWRFKQGPDLWGTPQPPVLYDLDADPTGTQTVAISPAQLEQLVSGYNAWFQDIHTVPVVFTPGEDGTGVLSARDFQRTPGYGPFTFGIGIGADHKGQIANQHGAWTLGKSANKVTAEFGATTLAGTLPADGDCHSIVISGEFLRQLASFSPPAKIRLALYIDGVKAESAETDGSLQVADDSVETVIGNPGGAGSNRILQPPVILDTELTPTTDWSLQAFSETLCPAT